MAHRPSKSRYDGPPTRKTRPAKTRPANTRPARRDPQGPPARPARKARPAKPGPRLHEGADAGDGAPDDQGVDLAGALVGVDRLGVGHEPAHMVLQQDAVPAQQLAGPADRFPHPDRAERLG